jgi:transcriptional regulator with XRE-family HTH domain
MRKDIKHIGDVLKILRNSLDESQLVFAPRVKHTQTHLSLIENGLRKPTDELLQDISNIFSVPYTTLKLAQFRFGFNGELDSEDVKKIFQIIDSNLKKFLPSVTS